MSDQVRAQFGNKCNRNAKNRACCPLHSIVICPTHKVIKIKKLYIKVISNLFYILDTKRIYTYAKFNYPEMNGSTFLLSQSWHNLLAEISLSGSDVTGKAGYPQN